MGKKYTIQHMQGLALERHGSCLSKSLNRVHDKLTWKCVNDHVWDAKAYKIIQGSWCAICSSSLSERIARFFMENIFKCKFPKKYPKWLINNDGNRMELDGYNQKMGIAFEYQGRQHFDFIKYWHKNRKNFKKRIVDDEKKIELCRSKNIILIQIPYTVKYDDMQEFIKMKYEELTGKSIRCENVIDYRKMDIYSNYKLKELREIARDRGGTCLSSVYVNETTKLEWKCGGNHKWKATPHSVRTGNWCHRCSMKKYYASLGVSIGHFKKFANQMGGECLSTKYVNQRTNLIWKCKKGHVWEACWERIRNGSWCPICSGRVITIEQMQEIAKERGGECLSKKYVNSRTKLRWRCEKDHEWNAIPNTIKNRGSWCPFCKGLNISINDMIILAKKMGGSCLSKKYVNDSTKLIWKCGKCNRVWRSTPGSVKQGHWCPKCAVKKRIEARKINSMIVRDSH